MIEELVPDCAAAAEAFGDAPGAALSAREAAVVAGCAEKRRREFITVRACARAALGRLGAPPASIVPDASGAPVWPTGIVGSMTHCAGYRAVVAARLDDILAIGVDAEPNRPLRDGVLAIVAGPDERAALAGHPPGVCWDRLLFSAKEAVYKTWFPATRRWLGFRDAAVSVDAVQGTFRVHLHTTAERLPRELTGRWLVRRGLIVTAVSVLAARPDRAAVSAGG